MTTTTYRRTPAFDSLSELLEWSERHGAKVPVVYEGPDGSCRGSVEVTEAVRLDSSGGHDE